MHEGAQAGRNSGVAIRSELVARAGVVGPGRGAVVQKYLWDLGDAGKEAFVLCPLRGKDPVDPVDVYVGTQRRAENEKALAVAWQRPLS